MQDPSPWIVRFADLLPTGGHVLDLASGGGRHGRFFLDRGHPVTALDRDVAALEHFQLTLNRQAARSPARPPIEHDPARMFWGWPGGGAGGSDYIENALSPRENLEIIQHDLEAGGPWPLGGRRFAAVVVVNYLYRPLLPAIIQAVAPGGLLLYDTFAAGNEAFGRPANPDFLLRPDELTDAVAGELEVVDFFQGRIEVPKPAIKQQICARRSG